MTSLIEEYNHNLMISDEFDTDKNEVNTVDLDSKFTELTDYITDYSQ